MKGVIFTEFLDMVDAQFSPELTERIVGEADLPSGGIYTAVGTYDHMEIIRLVELLAEHTGHGFADLVQAYGSHLFNRFVDLYPHFFHGVPDALTFLEGVEEHIHTEVRKLYSDAEPPILECQRPVPDVLVMYYKSERGMADVAHGLIQGCINHFKEDAEIRREELNGGKHVRFEIVRQAA